MESGTNDSAGLLVVGFDRLSTCAPVLVLAFGVTVEHPTFLVLKLSLEPIRYGYFGYHRF